MAWANRFVSTIAAEISWLGRELPRANVGGNFLNNLLGLIELFGVPRRGLNLIVLQIVKNQPHGIPLEYLARRDGINAEL